MHIPLRLVQINLIKEVTSEGEEGVTSTPKTWDRKHFLHVVSETVRAAHSKY